MPSLIKGYNYDIFISHRQKDNQPSLCFGLLSSKLTFGRRRRLAK